MEAKTTPSAAERAANLGIGTPKPWCGIGVRAHHWQLIKDVTRLVLPELQPARRLEFIARAFGYRTSAALQAAVAAAGTEDLYLAPRRGRLDEFRQQAIIQAIDSDLDQDGCDRFIDAGALVCAGLLLAHRTGKPPKSLQEIEAFEESLAFEIKAPGRTQTSLGVNGPIDLEKFLPDLRECTIGSWRYSQEGYALEREKNEPGDPWVEIVDTGRGSPSAEAIRRIGGKGDVHARTFAEAAHYLDEPDYAPHEMAATLLARRKDGTPRGFMTVRFQVECREAHHEDVAEYIYLDHAHPIEDEDILTYQMKNWDLTVLFEGFGVSAREDEDSVLTQLGWALRALLQHICWDVRNSANASGERITTRVIPEEGEDFGFLIFDTMIQWIEKTLEDIDDGYEADPGMSEDHEFEYCEP